MFGVSLFELAVIMAVALIVLGPDKLPEAASTFGKLMGALKKNSDAIRREFYNSVYKPANDLNNQVEKNVRNLIALDEKADPKKESTEAPKLKNPDAECPQEKEIKKTETPGE